MNLYEEARQMIQSLYDETTRKTPPTEPIEKIEALLTRLELAAEGVGKLLVVVDTRQRWEDDDKDVVSVQVFSTAEPQEWGVAFVTPEGVEGLEDWGFPYTTITTGRLERILVHLPESLSWGPSKL